MTLPGDNDLIAPLINAGRGHRNASDLNETRTIIVRGPKIVTQSIKDTVHIPDPYILAPATLFN